MSTFRKNVVGSPLVSRTQELGVGADSYSVTLTGTPIAPGSVVISSSSTTDLVTDNGDGTLSGTEISAGTVNYLTGAVSITYSGTQLTGSAVNATYNTLDTSFEQSVGTGDGSDSEFEATLAHIPIVPGSVVVTVGAITGIDDKNGEIHDASGNDDFTHGSTVSSTIDYTTGNIFLTMDSAPSNGVEVHVQYSQVDNNNLFDNTRYGFPTAFAFENRGGDTPLLVLASANKSDWRTVFSGNIVGGAVKQFGMINSKYIKVVSASPGSLVGGPLQG